jgi:hypothetical protein
VTRVLHLCSLSYLTIRASETSNQLYLYLVDLFKTLPYAKTADDYEALLPWKLGKPARKPTT